MNTSTVGPLAPVLSYSPVVLSVPDGPSSSRCASRHPRPGPACPRSPLPRPRPLEQPLLPERLRTDRQPPSGRRLRRHPAHPPRLQDPEPSAGRRPRAPPFLPALADRGHDVHPRPARRDQEGQDPQQVPGVLPPPAVPAPGRDSSPHHRCRKLLASSKPSRARPSTSFGSASARADSDSTSARASALRYPKRRAVCPRHRPARPSKGLPDTARVPTCTHQCSTNSRSSSFNALPTKTLAASPSCERSRSARSNVSTTTS
jgi:hypothetical protein